MRLKEGSDGYENVSDEGEDRIVDDVAFGAVGCFELFLDIGGRVEEVDGNEEGSGRVEEMGRGGVTES